MKEIKDYLAEVGRRGGKKSRRHLDSATARDMVRVREARLAFRRYRLRCFWSSPADLEIRLEDVPWVAEQLKRYGDREAWRIGARLSLSTSDVPNRSGRLLVVLAATAVLIAGCEDRLPGSETTRSGPSATGEEAAPSTDPESDALPSGLEVRELFRIRPVGEATEAEPFGRVVGVEMNDAGAICVLDGMAASVQMFGPDGAYIRSFGGPGQGPGEFCLPNGLVMAPDGRLLVNDTRGNRLTAFDLDGTLVETYP